jgi:hypothetical protein
MFSHTRKGLSTRLSTILGFALLFLALGFGNLLYGKFKLESYYELFRTEMASESTQIVDEDEMETISDEEKRFRDFLNLGEQDLKRQQAEDRRRKIAARLEFYELVVMGGKSFLAFAGALFLVFLLGLSARRQQSSSAAK